MSFLSINNEEECRAAFELMGDAQAFENPESFYSFQGAIQQYYNLIDRIDIVELAERINDTTGIIIYGNGGFHRYFVRMDGIIMFSARHCSFNKNIINDAIALGFVIFR